MECKVVFELNKGNLPSEQGGRRKGQSHASGQQNVVLEIEFITASAL